MEDFLMDRRMMNLHDVETNKQTNKKWPRTTAQSPALLTTLEFPEKTLAA